MYSHNRLVIILITFLSLLAAPSAHADAAGAAAAAARTPVAVVETLHETLIASMKGDLGPTFETRRNKILDALDDTFDLAFMARISLGKAWRTLTPDQQDQFFDLSRLLSASNYASNFDSYGGQHFATLGEEPAARNTILVKTEFVQPDDDNVAFDYRLRKSDGIWRIIDVTLDGKVSEITLRRADYTSYVKREGFDSLVEQIEEKIAKLATE